jgi:hypothetical protein
MRPGSGEPVRVCRRDGCLEAADAARFRLPPLGVIGGVLFEEVAPDGTYISVTMQGHLLVDICTALS